MRYQSLIDFGLMDWLLRKVSRFKAGRAHELRGRRSLVILSLSSGRISHSAGLEESAHHAMDCFFSTSLGPLADTTMVYAFRLGKDLGKNSNLKLPAKSHRINGPYVRLRAHNPKSVAGQAQVGGVWEKTPNPRPRCKFGTWGTQMTTMPALILFAEGLDVGFAVGIEQVFAALLPGGF